MNPPFLMDRVKVEKFFERVVADYPFQWVAKLDKCLETEGRFLIFHF